MRISDWSSDVCSSDLRDQPDNGVEPDWPVDAGHDEGALQNRLQRLDPPADGGRVVSVASHHPSEIIDLIGGDASHGFVSSRQSRNSCRFCLGRSEEHTSELQSLMRISYAVFCLKK